MYNKVKLAITQLNNKLSDLLISPKTTLTWFVINSSAAGWLVPLLAPVRESGSMLPQWWLSHSRLGNMKRRDVGWRIGILIQFVTATVLTMATIWLDGPLLTYVLLAAFSLMSLGRALQSAFSKDVQAKLVDNGKRGKFIGSVGSVSGFITILCAIPLLLTEPAEHLVWVTSGFALVSVSWLFTLLVSHNLKVEVKDAGTPNQSSLLQQLRSSKPLWHLVVIRCLLLHAMLLIPVFAWLLMGQDDASVAWLILASGASALLSSKVWGKAADKNAVRTMLFSGLGALVVSILLIWSINQVQHVLSWCLFFSLLMCYEGTRVSRKVMLLQISNDENRLRFVAAGNTVVGIFLVLAGAFYAVFYSASGTELANIMLCMLGLGVGFLIRTRKVFK